MKDYGHLISSRNKSKVYEMNKTPHNIKHSITNDYLINEIYNKKNINHRNKIDNLRTEILTNFSGKFSHNKMTAKNLNKESYKSFKTNNSKSHKIDIEICESNKIFSYKNNFNKEMKLKKKKNYDEISSYLHSFKSKSSDITNLKRMTNFQKISNLSNKEKIKYNIQKITDEIEKDNKIYVQSYLRNKNNYKSQNDHMVILQPENKINLKVKGNDNDFKNLNINKIQSLGKLSLIRAKTDSFRKSFLSYDNNNSNNCSNNNYNYSKSNTFTKTFNNTLYNTDRLFNNNLDIKNFFNNIKYKRNISGTYSKSNNSNSYSNNSNKKMAYNNQSLIYNNKLSINSFFKNELNNKYDKYSKTLRDNLAKAEIINYEKDYTNRTSNKFKRDYQSKIDSLVKNLNLTNNI